jgi:hypothetical protein
MFGRSRNGTQASRYVSAVSVLMPVSGGDARTKQICLILRQPADREYVGGLGV